MPISLDSYLNQPLPFESEVNKYLGGRQDLVIFEIGACEGEDTIKLSRKFPLAKIYAFEPLPKNIRRMKSNYSKYDATNIDAYQLALSDRNGSAEFFVSSGHPPNIPKSKSWDYGNKSSSLLEPKEHKNIHQWVKFKQKISVKTKTLESFCDEHSINKIDLVYLDVQGAELMVLGGAGKMLRNISMIWMEVEAVELYSGQPLRDDVERFMSRNGFRLAKNTVDSVAGDQLYVSEHLAKGRIVNSVRLTVMNKLRLHRS